MTESSIRSRTASTVYHFSSSIWQVIATLVLSFVISASTMASGQSTVAAAVPARDPQAITRIQAALNAMGGAGNWANIQSAITAGSSTSNDAVVSSTFTWDDEWSSDTQMKRDTVAKDGTHRTFLQNNTVNQSGTTLESSDSRLSQLHPPHFDRTTALILHLPAAVLSIALQDQNYGISLATPPPLSRTVVSGLDQTAMLKLLNSACVRIWRPSRSNASSVAIVMCFSTSGSLPVYSQVAVPNLLVPSRPLPETVIYSQYRAEGDLSVPETVMIITPARKVKTITFTSISLNPTLPSSTFSEVQQ